MPSFPAMDKIRHCLYCGAPLYGRPDKQFCSNRCKDAWHNSRKSLIRKTRADVMDILESNHSILASLSQSGQSFWLTSLVEEMGFRYDYFTRLVGFKRGYMVCECFDIRYRVSKTKLTDIAVLYDTREENDTHFQRISASRS